MPVYNASVFVQEAIESILSQTFSDFELIVVDDGSTDNSLKIIASFNDQRIRLIRNKHDFIGSLNKGLQVSKGKYITRMDSDDIMYPHRLERQFHFMEAHSEIAVCASQMYCFGNINQRSFMIAGAIHLPLVHMLESNIIANPTSIIRTSFLKEYQLSYERYNYAEDYKLWSEIAQKGGKFYVLPEVLLKYRISDGQISSKKQTEQWETSLLIKTEILEFLINQHKQTDRLIELYEALRYVCEQGMIRPEQLFGVFHSIFYNEHRLNTRIK
jgi:glycosyltransferase involved in cell wall biosynthesis